MPTFDVYGPEEAPRPARVAAPDARNAAHRYVLATGREPEWVGGLQALGACVHCGGPVLEGDRYLFFGDSARAHLDCPRLAGDAWPRRLDAAAALTVALILAVAAHLLGLWLRP